MIPRAYKGAALLLAIIVLCSLSYCRGKSEARLDVQEEAIDRKLDSLQTENRTLADSVGKQEKKIASLEKRTAPIRTKYVTLRDTLYKIDSSGVDSTGVDEAIDIALGVATYADSLIALQDTTISTQKLEIGALKGLVSIRDEGIRLLNQRNELAAKRISSARREGFVVGVATAAFVAVTIKGLK